MLSIHDKERCENWEESGIGSCNTIKQGNENGIRNFKPWNWIQCNSRSTRYSNTSVSTCSLHALQSLRFQYWQAMSVIYKEPRFFQYPVKSPTLFLFLSNDVYCFGWGFTDLSEYYGFELGCTSRYARVTQKPDPSISLQGGPKSVFPVLPDSWIVQRE